MTLSTRLATAADHPTFARLFPELGVANPLPDLEQFARRMLPRVMLVSDETGPIGYAFWQLYGTTAHIVQVVVDGGARGRGVGRALMQALRAQVIAEGCQGWYLNVKIDNHAAIALYRRCGLQVELESFALRLAWADVARLPEDAAVAFVPAATDDAAIAARFPINPARIAFLRARTGTVLCALAEAGQLVAFAAFDPHFPGVYPIRVARPTLARPLLEALHPHAQPDTDATHLMVEGDRPLADLLRSCGASLSFELRQMGSAL